MTALQFPSITIVSLCMYQFFFVNMSFKNLAQSGICQRASPKGKVISSFLKMSRNLAKCRSLSLLEGTNGYGTSLPSTGVISILKPHSCSSFSPHQPSFFLFHFSNFFLFLFLLFHFLFLVLPSSLFIFHSLSLPLHVPLPQPLPYFPFKVQLCGARQKRRRCQ